MTETGNVTLPQAPDIERAVLGAMMFEREAIDIAIETLGEKDVFYKPAHGIIFRAMVDLATQGAPVDMLTVSDILRQRGVLDQIGGEAVIGSISGEITSAANIAFHCRLLKEKYALRELILLTTSIRNHCYENDADPNNIAKILQDGIIHITEHTSIKDARNIRDCAFEAIDLLQRRIFSEKITGIPTGLTRLDWLLDGWQPGDMYILAGRPKEGKSALAGNFSVAAAKAGFPVIIYNLEMKGRDTVLRIVSGECKRNLSPLSLRRNKPGKDELGHIIDIFGAVSNLPIWIDETAKITVSQILARTRRLQREHDIKLVIVDYLQLMGSDENARNREQEVSKISGGLKAIAKTLNIPVIALSQLTREPSRDKRVPELHDLRESGSLEQDTDNAMFIWNPPDKEKMKLLEKYDFRFSTGIPVNEMDKLRQILVKANRHGEIGGIYTYFNKDILSFYDLEYRND